MSYKYQLLEYNPYTFPSPVFFFNLTVYTVVLEYSRGLKLNILKIEFNRNKILAFRLYD